MFIHDLRLASARLDRQKSFYTETLKLPLVAVTADSFTIRAGATLLAFERDRPSRQPYYHFAFNIPENKLALARAWLLAAGCRLNPIEGQDVVAVPAWNAHALYFDDPAGNIVEFIARHDLKNAAEGPFTSSDVLCVSEIALVVDDVGETVKALKSSQGLDVYRGMTDNFAAVGDEHGLLILTLETRPWFGTDRLPGRFPTAAICAVGEGEAARGFTIETGLEDAPRTVRGLDAQNAIPGGREER